MILVTGGAGYIGSHCVLSLLEQGKDVVVFDNLSTGHIETIENLKKIGNLIFIRGDLQSKTEIQNVFKNHTIKSVIHFAAFSQVGESVKNPQKYYLNNVCGTLNLLEKIYFLSDDKELKLNVYYRTDDYGDVYSEGIEDKTHDIYFGVHDLYECPEDAIIGRDLFDSEDYIKALNKGIELAELGYSEVVANRKKEED